ncbi:hypothetical protein GWI33_000596 [Rhynchophorus ferrugineus]|uniref:Uncharacterized protein n=1 Tax=Rhynchophorus ferrugineus TaxID=354439 RepID=A0A834HM11_RHYFE|nr:hypothetical protein GWI33_000596 [Rhynchophorus ferrugineus]
MFFCSSTGCLTIRFCSSRHNQGLRWRGRMGSTKNVAGSPCRRSGGSLASRWDAFAVARIALVSRLLGFPTSFPITAQQAARLPAIPAQLYYVLSSIDGGTIIFSFFTGRGVTKVGRRGTSGAVPPAHTRYVIPRCKFTVNRLSKSTDLRGIGPAAPAGWSSDGALPDSSS